jgi:hypothetical protein
VTITIPRKVIVVLALAVCALVAGIAVAAWSVSTSGNGSAKASTASALTLGDASGSTSGDLYPGGAGDLKLKLSNPNPFPVRVTAVALTSGGTITSNAAACDSGGNGVSLTTQSGLTIDLAANAANQVATVSGAVHMASSAPNACQGAVFTIPVDVTASSN